MARSLEQKPSGPGRLPIVGRCGHVWKQYGIVLVVCVSVVFSVLSFGPKLTGTDDATYIVVAKALVTGAGFSKVNLQGNPPETYYPPGFPLLLAPVLALFPEWPDYAVPLAVVPVVFGILSVAAAWLLFRELGAGPHKALAIALVMATSYVGVGWYTASVILSESCYMFFTLVALLLLQRFVRAKSRTWLLLAALAIGMSYLVRTVGIALMMAAVVYFFCRKEYRSALALLLAGLVFVAPWLYRTAMIRRSELGQAYGDVFLISYLDTFLLRNWQRVTLGQAGLADYVARFVTNVRGHNTVTILQLLFPTLTGEHLVTLLRTVHLDWLPSAVGIGSVALIVMGWIERMWKSRGLPEVYLFFYVLTILLPSWYTVRNLVPILPFLVYYLLAGVRWLAERVSSGLQARRLSLIVMGLILVAIVGSNLSSDRHMIAYGAAFRRSGAPYVETQPGFLEACEWIRNNTDPEDLIVYRSSEKMYLCSGQQAPPALSTMPISLGARDPYEVFAAILEHADWVVVTTTEEVVPLTAGEPIDYQGMPVVNQMIESEFQHFALIYETAGPATLKIYRVDGSAVVEHHEEEPR